MLKLLLYWYRHQPVYIEWKDSISQPFLISNGIRQGGILSPYLFNVYVDELSGNLNSQHKGCYIGDVCVNHLSYADDMVLMVPNIKVLQALKTCDSFTSNGDILNSSMAV